VSRALFSIIFALALLAVVFSIEAGSGWAEGFSLRKLNPFGGSSAKPSRPSASSSRSSWFKMPSLPSFGSSSARPTAARQPKQPSMLARMNHSTKQFFHKTKSALTPGSKEPAPPSMFGSGSSMLGAAPKPEPKPSGNILTSWFKSEPQDKRPSTPSDWISQPRTW
jgi:hypothetical protein